MSEVTYICILISSNSDELSLREDERLSFRREEGVLRAILLYLHDVKTRLVFMEGLENYHLEKGRCNIMVIWLLKIKSRKQRYLYFTDKQEK